MAFLDSRKSIVSVSLGIAIVLVVGAYVLSGRHLGIPAVANAESTDAILKAYAAKDSDNDGLPDWEEALYGTDPNNPHSIRPTLTDGDAVAQGIATPRYNSKTPAATSEDLAAGIPGATPPPDSLTQQFSLLFFNNYMATRGDKQPTSDQMQTFVQGAVGQLAQTRVQADAFSASQIKIAGHGPAAMEAYAAAMGQILIEHNPQTPYSELTYFSDIVERNDQNAPKSLQQISSSYTNAAAAAAAIPVPTEAAQAHLALVNSMAHLGSTISDLASVNTDPIRAMLGLRDYPQSAGSLARTFAGMKPVFDADSLSIPSGSAGGSFYAIVTSAAANATTTP